MAGAERREKSRGGVARRHSISLFSRAEGRQHTLPFGAVTPGELWSPNEWLGRAKRRITYYYYFFFFFFFFFLFSRFTLLFSRMSINTGIESDPPPIVNNSFVVPAGSRWENKEQRYRRVNDRNRLRTSIDLLYSTPLLDEGMIEGINFIFFFC